MVERDRLAQRVVEQAGALRLYARQWLDDGASAEDAVQEALTSLLMQCPSPLDPIAWMYRAVRNAAIDAARSSTRRRRREREVAESRREWFEARPDALIDAKAAEAALETLAPESREIVVLRIWGGLGFAQIAAVTAVSLSTVHDRYVAALRRMRGALEKPCETNTRTH